MSTRPLITPSVNYTKESKMDRNIEAEIALQDARRNVEWGTLHVQALVSVTAPYVSKAATPISFEVPNERREEPGAKRRAKLERLAVEHTKSLLKTVEGVEVLALGVNFIPCPKCIAREVNEGWGSRHQASGACQSGGNPHCTCRACF